MSEQFENFEIRLPEEVMTHIDAATKELLRAGFAYVATLYDDNPEDCDFKEMVQLLMIVMNNRIGPMFDEVVKELDE